MRGKFCHWALAADIKFTRPEPRQGVQPGALLGGGEGPCASILCIHVVLWRLPLHICPPPSPQVPEIQYFGASALHTKISRYWGDIPAEQYDSLKKQLFSQISHFASGSKMVLTRLCVALASLALNMMPEAWPGAVTEMVRAFQEEGGGADGRARCLALLELLTVLPEEFQTSRLPQYRKGQVRGALGQEWGSVLPLLQQLLRQADSPGLVKARVLKCLSSWVLLDVPLSESEGLVQDSFAALGDPELFDTAVEAIINAISQPDSQR